MDQALALPVSPVKIHDFPFYVELPYDATPQQSTRQLPALSRPSVTNTSAIATQNTLQDFAQVSATTTQPDSQELCRWSGRLIVALYILSGVVWPSFYVPGLGIVTGLLGEVTTRSGRSSVNTVLSYVAMNGAMVGVLLFVLIFDFAVRPRFDDDGAGPRSVLVCAIVVFGELLHVKAISHACRLLRDSRDQDANPA
ncbi:hypothetical protein PINS_up005258 [Pythium insidiosum]|nr:hypothetical protein PINS_up005258 [Pythium insidiosum]